MIIDSDISAFLSTKDDKNIAFHVGNNKQNVINNRRKLALKYNYDDNNLVYMEQTHSCNIKIVDEESNKLQNDCDALITNTKDLPIMVMVADCMPIFIYDQIKKVIAVVHSGRNGTFLNIAPKTIQKMIEKFDCDIENIKVYIGASICQDCYEVDESLVSITIKNFGKLYIKNNCIDLGQICIDQLLKIGVDKSNIVKENYCTKCSGNKYYSYRKSDIKAGRFALIALLRNSNNFNIM